MSEQIKDKVSKMDAAKILALCGSKSKAIRYMIYLGYTRSKISEILNIRYQHVRNVELEILKIKSLDLTAERQEIEAKISDGDDKDQLSLI